MYKHLIFLICLIVGISVQAQKRLEVDCPTPGELSSKISWVQQHEIEDIVVTGNINQADMEFVNQLACNLNVQVVDLGNATSVDGYIRLYFKILLSDKTF